MTKNGKCLWIVDTLLRSGGLSLRELNDRWKNSSLCEKSDTVRFHERTFARYKDFIADEYNIDIEYSSVTNKYHITNRDEVKHNALYTYLLSAFRVAELNTQALKHRDKLMLEPVPTGVEHLAAILQAIDKGYTVQFDYTSYYKPEPIRDWEVIPCFLRIFEGRWYLIAELTDHSSTRRLALERISGLRITGNRVEPSSDITPEEFYFDCYGIIREEERKPCLICLKADKQQCNYLRALPLHESQEETETTEEYSVFTYYLRPSFDLFQRILWMREKVEIIAPKNVREEMAEIVRKLAEIYIV